MNLTNLKNGIGFVVQQEIFDRLRRFTPPDKESYFVKQGRYSVVGVSWYGVKKKLFCIYSGDQELYNLICEMVKESVEKIGYPVNIEEWSNDESQ